MEDELRLEALRLAAEYRKLQRENAKVLDALKAYYASHRITICAPGTEFVIRTDRTLEVK